MPRRNLQRKKTKSAPRSKRRAWSASDIRQLRQLAGCVSVKQIARRLGRSVPAVTFKAFTLRKSLRVRR